MTVIEAATALGLKPVTVRRHIAKGLLYATWDVYARRWGITPMDVEMFRQKRRSAGRPKR